MGIKVRTILKGWFKTGAYPTEPQFGDLIDSFYHKSEDSINMAKIDGLTEALASKQSIITDENPNTSHEVTEFPGSIDIITAAKDAFTLAIVIVIFSNGTDHIKHEVHIPNDFAEDANPIKDITSYEADGMDDYDMTLTTTAENKAKLTITFNTAPGTILISKPQINYF